MVYLFESFDVQIEFCTRYKSQFARVRLHGQGHELSQAEQRSDQQTVLDIEDNDWQESDDPDNRVRGRQSPESAQVTDLQEHSFQRYNDYSSEDALHKKYNLLKNLNDPFVFHNLKKKYIYIYSLLAMAREMVRSTEERTGECSRKSNWRAEFFHRRSVELAISTVKLWTACKRKMIQLSFPDPKKIKIEYIKLELKIRKILLHRSIFMSNILWYWEIVHLCYQFLISVDFVVHFLSEYQRHRHGNTVRHHGDDEAVDENCRQEVHRR